MEYKKEILYTAEEVAVMHKYAVTTVWKRCREYEKGAPGGWPHRRDGRAIRFTKDDLQAINELMNPEPVEATSSSGKRRPLAV